MTAKKNPQKLVYQTNHERILVGTCYADESPLEPGVWMIPGGCVDLAPPGIPAGKLCRWDSGAWVLEDIPAPPVERAIEQMPAGDPELEAKATVQAFMDQTAKSNGYENLISAISYADEEAVPSFQQDGKDFRAWRSLVWQYVYAELALWHDEPERASSLLELLQDLPALPGEHAQVDPKTWAYMNPE